MAHPMQSRRKGRPPVNSPSWKTDEDTKEEEEDTKELRHWTYFRWVAAETQPRELRGRYGDADAGVLILMVIVWW